jgi:hypothetical protein
MEIEIKNVDKGSMRKLAYTDLYYVPCTRDGAEHK